MKVRFALAAMCVLAVLASACRINPEAALRISQRMEATRLAGLPTPTATAPPPFLALCLVKSTTRIAMRTTPNDKADVVTSLSNRDVLSVTLRSEDAQWVYAQSTKQLKGWVQVKTLGCTVPVEELVPPTRTPSPALLATQTAAAIATSTAAALPTATSTASPVSLPTQTPIITAAATTATPLTTAPTVVLSPTVTLTIAPSTPLPSAAPELRCTVAITRGLNVRRGPGTNFGAFVRLNLGQVFVAVGRNADATWLGGRVETLNRTGWVIAQSVRCDGDAQSLPVLQGNDIPEATAVSATSPTPTLTPTPAVAVAPTVAATPEPTAVQALTVTLTPTQVVAVAATATATATATAAAAVSDAGIQCSVVATTGVNVREGPARNFKVQGIATFGERFVAVGRTANNQWLFGTSAGGFTGWAVAGGIRCAEPIRRLPVRRQ